MTAMKEWISNLGKLSFLTKIAAIVNSSVILGFYSGVYQWLLVYGDAHQMVLPFPVCGSFLIITVLICLAQLCNRKTPAYLVIVFDAQAVLLFATVGATCFACWGKALGIEIIGPPPIPMPHSLDRQSIFVSAVLGCINSLLYALDAGLTYRERWNS